MIDTGWSENSKRETIPKLPPPPAQTPQQLGPLGLTDGHDVAVGRHDVRADQVVARQSVLALQPADAAAEREAGDSGGRDQAARRRETVRRGRGIEVGPGRTGLRPWPCAGRRRRRRCASTERSMTTPPSQVLRPATLWPPPRTASGRPAARVSLVAVTMSSIVRHSRDQRRPRVDAAVPDGSTFVVVRAVGRDHHAFERRCERVEQRRRVCVLDITSPLSPSPE